MVKQVGDYENYFIRRILNLFRKNGHMVVGVFTIPDKNGREVRKNDLNGTMMANQTCCEKTKRFAKTYDQDPLAIAASADGVPVFKFKSWRLKGVARPEVLLKSRFQ